MKVFMYGLRRLSRVEVNKGVLPNNQIKKKITFIFLKFFQKTLSFSCVVVFMYGIILITNVENPFPCVQDKSSLSLVTLKYHILQLFHT